MAGGERLDEDVSRLACLMDVDCERYSVCFLAHGCRCQVWGECVLVRVAGQPCHSDSQCAVGLVCRNSSARTRTRCVPDTHLEDLPRFADLPEPDLGSHPDIPATYGGPVLVASISLALVLLCLALAAWCRLTTPSTGTRADMEMTAPSSVLISMNHVQPLPCYASTHHLFSPPHMHHHSRDQ